MFYLPLLTFCGFSIWLSWFDIRHRRLPNRQILALYLMLLLLTCVSAVMREDWYILGNAVKLSASTFAFYLVLHLISRKSIGAGDVKFSASTGFVLGLYSPHLWLLSLWLSFSLASLYAITVYLLKRQKQHLRLRSMSLPFGPFMVVGTVIPIIASFA